MSGNVGVLLVWHWWFCGVVVGGNVGGFVGFFVALHCDLNDGCDGHE